MEHSETDRPSVSCFPIGCSISVHLLSQSAIGCTVVYSDNSTHTLCTAAQVCVCELKLDWVGIRFFRVWVHSLESKIYVIKVGFVINNFY